MKKPKILIIQPFIPYPLNTGGNQAMYNGIKAIYSNTDVYLTFETKNTQEDQENIYRLQEKLGGTVKIIPYIKEEIKENKSILKEIHIFLWKIKLFILSFLGYSQNFKQEYKVWQGKYNAKDDSRVDFINRIIDKHKINIVQCEMLQTAPYALTLPPKVKKIFVHHEIGFIREELNVISKTKNPEIYSEDLEIYKKNEVEILNKFDCIITLSAIDTKKLKSAGVIVPIETSLAIVKFEPQKKIISEDYKTLTFVGPSCHNPNVVGIKWFLENCWHKLKSIDSEYKLQIIGNWEKVFVQEIKRNYSNIIFKGFVEDLSSTIQNTIMIVPITVGSGIRMKILEACVNGVPVISTSVGAEGLPLIDGEDCLIANTPENFINSILKMKDKNLRMQFIHNSMKKIIELYSFDTLKRNRNSILDNVIRK